MDQHEAVPAIREALTAFAHGDYQRRVPEQGPLREVAAAVNVLGEHLARHQPMLEAQFDTLLEQLLSLASFEFARRVPVDHGGEGFRALATGLNMLTEELEAVVAVRDRAQELYQLAFEHAPIGMVLAERDGTFVQVNPAFGAMLGADPASLVGCSWRDITHPDDLMESNLKFDALYRGDVRRIDLEKRYVVSGGKVIWGQANVTIVRDDAGRPVYSLAQVVDITQRKASADALREARDRALESDRLKTEFLRNVSHEIRTPMTSVLGMTELALGTKLTDLQRDYLEIAMVSGRSLLDLVDGILQLSKIESGQVEPDITPVDVRATVRKALDPLRARAELGGLAFGIDVDEAVPDVVCTDGGWVNQILTNLAANAIKFTPQGRVDVRVEARQGHLVFVVADTGIGVPEESRELIFHPFRQADGSTTRVFGGTGLGLAITARLVHHLGGTVDVASNRRGGASFTVTVPLVRPDEWGNDSSNPALPRRLDGVRALVAEDRPDHRLMIASVLEEAGCAVTAVGNGREAVDAAAMATFDVALLDLQMPEMDGLAAIAAIRSGEEGGTRRVPILAVTAHALDVDRDRALAAGADDYVLKPFSAPSLVEAVATTLAVGR